MSVSVLVGNIYFPLSAPHTNLCLPVPVPVFDSTILIELGEDLLLLLVGLVSSV